ncbi:uncharacterized protein LOC120418410 [Culex pipiens pallens]|uniref:uncharacterized protein LOC120418410 n=1 Tax=Culex pipiens pallens TaxID=42434 RepID=UPI001953A28A|nr:uncharacterized protein LOC120418410 [Culex pipiens pallens]
MKFLLRIIGLLLMLLAFDAASYANAFIVPEELPSILSLVYSNIPPIKKGTDSRLGFGFRLGDHADFQVQFEIGPQQRTRPIGSLSGNNKRDVDSEDYQNYKKQTSSASNSKNPGKTWLETWSKETKQKQHFNKEKHRDAIQSGGAGPSSSSSLAAAAVPTGMPASPMIDHSAFNQLQQLYDMNKSKDETLLGTLPAAELDERLNAQKRSELVFRPMPADNEVEPSGLPSFKPLPAGTMSGTLRKTTPRRNVVRRRTTGSAANSQKDKISADLADVSLD